MTREEALRNLVIATGRMIDNWAESDKAVRNQLWQGMAKAHSDAGEYVYPL